MTNIIKRLYKTYKINRKKKKSLKYRRRKIEESKLYMRWILFSSIPCMYLSYILAFLGRDEIAESLSKCIVVNIIGTFCIYSVKAFFGKKEEADNELKKMQMFDDDDCNCEDYSDEEESMR